MNDFEFERSEVNHKIQHLTYIQINDLMERYYCGESIKKLLQEFHIDIRPSQLISLFPICTSKSTNCPFCKIPFSIFWKSRSSYEEQKSEECLNCAHKSKGICSCYNCFEIKRKKLEKINSEKTNILSEVYSNLKRSRFYFKNITLRDKLYIGALLKTCLSEDNETINAIDSSLEALSPTKKYTEEILYHLYEKRIIIFSMKSDINCFDLDSGYLKSFDVLKVTWELNINPIGFYGENLLNWFLYPDPLTNEEIENIIILWREVALQEAIEHSYSLFIEHNLPIYNFSDRTYQSLNYVLTNYSISQVCYLLYKAVIDILTYKQKQSIPGCVATKIFPTKLEYWADRYKSNNWPVHERIRYRQTQSSISKFLSDSVLKIGDRSYNLIPNKESILAYCNNYQELI